MDGSSVETFVNEITFRQCAQRFPVFQAGVDKT